MRTLCYIRGQQWETFKEATIWFFFLELFWIFSHREKRNSKSFQSKKLIKNFLCNVIQLEERTNDFNAFSVERFLPRSVLKDFFQ